MQRQLRWGLAMMAFVMMNAVCSAATIGVRLSDLIRQPAYARALQELLDQAGNLPGWTRELLKSKGAYVGGIDFPKVIDGTTYHLFTTAPKVYRGSPNSLAVMFAPNGTQAWGVLLQGETMTALGSPSDAQQAVMKRELRPEIAKETGPYLFDVVKNPAYAQALKRLFDQAGILPSWVRELSKGKGSYTSTSAAPTAIYGTTYEMFCLCAKEFSCTDTYLAIMFAPNATQAWGVLSQEGTIVHLGAPSDAQLAAMRGALEAYSAKWKP